MSVNAAHVNYLSWFGIVRLGLVQTALGSIVVMTTSTLNRVMVVELAFPAMLPGILVALHYFIQVLRPMMGYGSDIGQRRTPWIIGGMAVLAAGGIGAAAATATMTTMPILGIFGAVVAFLLIGLGVGASGTSLLVLLAKRVDPQRRAAAATVVWIMMIAGFILTATLAGHFLDPFTTGRLVAVMSVVATVAFLITLVAVWRIEGAPTPAGAANLTAPAPAPFIAAMREVWAESDTRRFAIFIFVSMLAYSAQDLILEPFAGTVFGFSPGESTKLAGVQHSGVLLGMILVGAGASGLAARLFGDGRWGSLRGWVIGGCAGSALALAGLAFGGLVGPTWPLRANVFVLGVANGVFAIAAIGAMMTLVASGRQSREGVRMGLWGAAQAIAFGLGGFLGTVASDIAQYVLGDSRVAYAWVFGAEALLFVGSAVIAMWVNFPRAQSLAPLAQSSVPSPSAAGGHEFNDLRPIGATGGR